MEPNRFDDVETRIVDESVQPRAPRRTRRVGPAALAVVATAALMGSLAAGASALTSTAEAPTRAADRSTHHVSQGKRHGLCNKGEGYRRQSAELSY